MQRPLFPAAAAPPRVRAAPLAQAALLLPPPAGTPPFQYQWSRAGASLDDRFSSSEDAGGVRLTITAARTGDSGVYTLQASNAAGADTARVRLEVAADEAPVGDDPPSFLRRLQDLTVKVGTRTRFLVEIVSSTECNVTWYRNERRLLEAERVSLARDGSFWCADLSAVSVDDAGRWTCTAENAGGRASCSAHLNVLVPKAYKRPEFVEELRALLTEQGTVSLECKVVGVPTPVLRWFKDSREIKAGDVFALTANAEDPTSLGTYTCEAVNCMGRGYSSSKVHVGRAADARDPSARPTSSLSAEPPPIFTKELEDQVVKVTEPLTLSCQLVVPPWPRSVLWYNKEGKVEPGDKYHMLEDGVGGYLVEAASAEWPDEGEWKCVATSTGGRVGFSSCHVTMDVPKNYRKPRFMENLQAVLTEEGLVSFECKVVGFPTPVLSWFKDGQELKPGDVYQLTGTNSLGSYCCIARNCMGQASSSAELTVEDIQNQLNDEEKLQLFAKNQAPKFLTGLKSIEVKIDEPFRFTVKVAIPPEPSVLWYRDDQPVDESPRCHLSKEDKGAFSIDIQNLEFLDQAEWKCVAMNNFGHSVTSCFLKLVIPRHFKKPRFLENLQAILSDEGAVNLECKVIGVPQPVLKWYKDGEELKPGDIHRIISGQDGTCCLGTYTCEAQNCMGIAASSASLLGLEDSMKAKSKRVAEEQALERNLSLSTIHEERTSQMYDTPVGDITLDEKGEISFSFDGKEVSVSLYETPDLTEEEALQIVEMYADQLSENVTEHNVVELPPLRFVKETSTSGNLLMEAIIIDVSPDYFVTPEEDLRTEADVEDLSIVDDNILSQFSLDQDVDIGGDDYLEKTMSLLSNEKADFPIKSRRKSDSQRSMEDYFSLSKDLTMSENKKDDDTQVLSEVEIQSFASAKSSTKQKSKISKPSDEDQLSSDIPKTIQHKEELQKDIEPAAKPKRERRSSRSSRRSSSASEKSFGVINAEILAIDQVKAQQEMTPSLSELEFSSKLTHISTLITSTLNDLQIIERDIILKSELMSSAATASRSLEILSSLITPLSKMHSIAEATKEAAAEPVEVIVTLLSNIPESLKLMQQSCTMIEKCIEIERDSKTLVKKTCIAIVDTCSDNLQKVMININTLAKQTELRLEERTISEIDLISSEIVTVIKLATDTIKTMDLLNEAKEITEAEPSLETSHLRQTQKAVFELKCPLNSLLCIADNAESGKITEISKVKSSDVILNDMSASIQDLQTALEQIESLSVKESATDLNKYNTIIIETVMDSVLKLRSSFEQLSLDDEKAEDKEVLKQALVSIKQNLFKISSHIEIIENSVGAFDILQSDNKLEVLQRMAQILIALENNLSNLETMTELKSNMTLFHKNLTTVLENVIEGNESKKYFALIKICDVVNRVNTSLKTLDLNTLLSLASLSNTMKIIQDHFIGTVFESELNCAILNNINDILIEIQAIINNPEETSLYVESDKIQEIPTTDFEKSKAKQIVEHINQFIAMVSEVKQIESTLTLMSAITPSMEMICPVLEDLKRYVASTQQRLATENESALDMTDSSKSETLAIPICELNQNIIVLNHNIVENLESLKQDNTIVNNLAEPLQELYSALVVLQQDVVSQYDDLMPFEVSVNIASAVKNLHSCILLIQDQEGVEATEDMSTLEDVSAIKTTAEIIGVEPLTVPAAEETAVESEFSYFENEQPPTTTVDVLNAFNEHVAILQQPDVVEALDSLSEVSDFSSLKTVIPDLNELHIAIDEYLHPIVMESYLEKPNTEKISKLLAIAKPMQGIHNCLSVLDLNNIPLYENLLDMPSEKMDSVFQDINNFKERLEHCIHVIYSSIETTDQTIEISSKVEKLRSVCENMKNILSAKPFAFVENSAQEGAVNKLETVIDNILAVSDASKGIDFENLKRVTEEVFGNISAVQEEVLKFSSVTPEVVSQEANFINAIDQVEQSIAVLEQYDFVDLSKASDLASSASMQMATEMEVEKLAQMDDIVKNIVSVLIDPARKEPTADISKVEEFIDRCKNEFTLMKCLLSKQLSHKKIIRLLQEFMALQLFIKEFKEESNQLNVSDEVKEKIGFFTSEADTYLKHVENTLITAIHFQWDVLCLQPLNKVDNAVHNLQGAIKFNQNKNELWNSVNRILNVLLSISDSARACCKNLELLIIEDITNFSHETTLEENQLKEKLETMEIILKQEISDCNEDTYRNFLQELSDCINFHSDYKKSMGTGRTLILLKCLSECSEILEHIASGQIIATDDALLKAKLNESELKILISEIIVPLRTFQDQIKSIQEEDLKEKTALTLDLPSSESCLSTLKEVHNEISQIEHKIRDASERAEVIDNDDVVTLMNINKDIHVIKQSIYSMENSLLIEKMTEVAKPIEEIEKSLHNIMASTAVQVQIKDILNPEKITTILKDIENALCEDNMDVVNEISAVFNLKELAQSVEIANKLKENVAAYSSDIEKGYVIESIMTQCHFVQQLQNALSESHTLILENVDNMFASVGPNDIEKALNITAELQVSLSAIRIAQNNLIQPKIIEPQEKQDGVNLDVNVPVPVAAGPSSANDIIITDNEKAVTIMRELEMAVSNETIETVEAINALLNVKELAQTVDIARELKENIAKASTTITSLADTDVVDSMQVQSHLVQALKSALTESQTLILDNTNSLLENVATNDKERAVKVITDLLDNLDAIETVQNILIAPQINEREAEENQVDSDVYKDVPVSAAVKPSHTEDITDTDYSAEIKISDQTEVTVNQTTEQGADKVLETPSLQLVEPSLDDIIVDDIKAVKLGLSLQDPGLQQAIEVPPAEIFDTEKNTDSLLHTIKQYTSAEVGRTVEELSVFVQTDAVQQATQIAQELHQTFNTLEASSFGEIAQKLDNALLRVQTQVLVDAQSIAGVNTDKLQLVETATSKLRYALAEATHKSLTSVLDQELTENQTSINFENADKDLNSTEASDKTVTIKDTEFKTETQKENLNKPVTSPETENLTDESHVELVSYDSEIELPVIQIIPEDKMTISQKILELEENSEQCIFAKTISDKTRDKILSSNEEQNNNLELKDSKTIEHTAFDKQENIQKVQELYSSKELEPAIKISTQVTEVVIPVEEMLNEVDLHITLETQGIAKALQTELIGIKDIDKQDTSNVSKPILGDLVKIIEIEKSVPKSSIEAAEQIVSDNQPSEKYVSEQSLETVEPNVDMSLEVAKSKERTQFENTKVVEMKTVETFLEPQPVTKFDSAFVEEQNQCQEISDLVESVELQAYGKVFSSNEPLTTTEKDVSVESNFILEADLETEPEVYYNEQTKVDMQDEIKNQEPVIASLEPILATEGKSASQVTFEEIDVTKPQGFEEPLNTIQVMKSSNLLEGGIKIVTTASEVQNQSLDLVAPNEGVSQESINNNSQKETVIQANGDLTENSDLFIPTHKSESVKIGVVAEHVFDTANKAMAEQVHLNTIEVIGPLSLDINDCVMESSSKLLQGGIEIVPTASEDSQKQTLDLAGINVDVCQELMTDNNQKETVIKADGDLSEHSDEVIKAQINECVKTVVVAEHALDECTNKVVAEQVPVNVDVCQELTTGNNQKDTVIKADGDLSEHSDEVTTAQINKFVKTVVVAEHTLDENTNKAVAEQVPIDALPFLKHVEKDSLNVPAVVLNNKCAVDVEEPTSVVEHKAAPDIINDNINQVRQSIEAFTSDDISESVKELAEIINVHEIEQTLCVALELREYMNAIESQPNVLESAAIMSVETDNVYVLSLEWKLHNALSVLQTNVLDNTQNIEEVADAEKLRKVIDIVTHLQEDLAVAIVSQELEQLRILSSTGEEQSKEDNSMKHLENLLQEVSDKINVSSSKRKVGGDDDLRDTLDEVQTVIIKLRRDYDGVENEPLNEILEDLECSVRSVQLQISENSPPELLKEACATLILLVNNMRETPVTPLTIQEINKTEKMLESCSDGTQDTVDLIEYAVNIDSDAVSNLDHVILTLTNLKDTLSSLRLSFLGNAESLIEKGIDVNTSLQQVEDQVYYLEKVVSSKVNVTSVIRDSISTAIHSIFGSISNMRSTITSIQKQYLYDNYGRPSDKLLKSIKNFTAISKYQKTISEKAKWHRISKSLRKLLTHFEDIKFYVNLDKTARLPGETGFTKNILDELKENISHVASFALPDVVEHFENTLSSLETIISNIDCRQTLEVKEKIPIFSGISSQIIDLSELVLNHLRSQSSANFVEKDELKESVLSDEQNNLKEFNEQDIILETHLKRQQQVKIEEEESLNDVQQSKNLQYVSNDGEQPSTSGSKTFKNVVELDTCEISNDKQVRQELLIGHSEKEQIQIEEEMPKGTKREEITEDSKKDTADIPSTSMLENLAEQTIEADVAKETVFVKTDKKQDLQSEKAECQEAQLPELLHVKVSTNAQEEIKAQVTKIKTNQEEHELPYDQEESYQKKQTEPIPLDNEQEAESQSVDPELGTMHLLNILPKERDLETIQLTEVTRESENDKLSQISREQSAEDAIKLPSIESKEVDRTKEEAGSSQTQKIDHEGKEVRQELRRNKDDKDNLLNEESLEITEDNFKLEHEADKICIKVETELKDEADQYKNMEEKQQAFKEEVEQNLSEMNQKEERQQQEAAKIPTVEEKKFQEGFPPNLLAAKCDVEVTEIKQIQDENNSNQKQLSEVEGREKGEPLKSRETVQKVDDNDLLTQYMDENRKSEAEIKRVKVAEQQQLDEQVILHKESEKENDSDQNEVSQVGITLTEGEEHLNEEVEQQQKSQIIQLKIAEKQELEQQKRLEKEEVDTHLANEQLLKDQEETKQLKEGEKKRFADENVVKEKKKEAEQKQKEEVKIKKQKDAEKQQLEEQKRLKEEVDKNRLADDNKQKEQEKEKRIIEEAEKQLQDDANIQQQKEAEAQQLEKQKQLKEDAEKKRLADKNKLKEQEEEKRIKAEAERKQQEEAKIQQQREAEAQQLEEQKRLKEEAEIKRLADENKLKEQAEEKQIKEEADKKQQEEVKIQEQREAEAQQLEEQKRLKEESEIKRLADENKLKEQAEEKRIKEEAERKQKEEAKIQQQREAEAQQLEEQKRLKEEAEIKRLADENKLKEQAEEKRIKEEAERKQKEEAMIQEQREAEAQQLEEQKRLKEEAEIKRLADEKKLKEQAEEKQIKEEAEKKLQEEAKIQEQREAEAQQLEEQKRLKEEAEIKRLADENKLKEQAVEKRIKDEAEKKQQEEAKIQEQREAEAQQLEEQKRLKEEAEIKRLADEKKLKELEEEKRIKEEAEKKQQEEAKIQEQREAEAQQLEEQKRLKEEAEIKRLADEKKLKEQAEEKRIKEEAERKQKEEAKIQQQREAEAQQLEEQKRLKEEAEIKRLADENKLKEQAEEKRIKEEAERKQKEEAKIQEQREAEAQQLKEQKRLKEEAEIKRLADEKKLKELEEEKRIKEEAEKKQQEEAKIQQQKEAEQQQLEEQKRLKEEAEIKRLADEKKLKELEEEKRIKEEAEKKQQEEAKIQQQKEAEQQQLKEQKRLKKEAEIERLADEKKRKEQEEEKQIKEEAEKKQQEEAKIQHQKEAEKQQLKVQKRLKEEADIKRLADENKLKEQAEEKRIKEMAERKQKEEAKIQQQREAEAQPLEEQKHLKEEAEIKRLADEKTLNEQEEKKRIKEEEQIKVEADKKQQEEARIQQQKEAEKQQLKEQKRLKKEADIKRLTDEKKLKEQEEEKRIKEVAERKQQEEAKIQQQREAETQQLDKQKRLKEEAAIIILEKERQIKEDAEKNQQEEAKILQQKELEKQQQLKEEAEEKVLLSEKSRKKVLKKRLNEEDKRVKGESKKIHDDIKLEETKSWLRKSAELFVNDDVEVRNRSQYDTKSENSYSTKHKDDGTSSTKHLQKNESENVNYHHQVHSPREKPTFTDRNHRDYTMEFARPSHFREKTIDDFEVPHPDLSYSRGRGTIYKAQSLLHEAQLRSSLPPPTITTSRHETYNVVHDSDRVQVTQKMKEYSEARSINSEKRSSLPRDLRRKPVFSTHLTDRTAVEGSRVKLTCSVLCTTDTKITWYKNGIVSDNRLKYRTKFLDGLITFEVLNAVPSDSAEYSCVVENENGSVSSSASLKVYPSFESTPIPPTFTRSIRDTYHLVENELVLECRIRGQPLPTIMWLKDDKTIESKGRYQSFYLADGVCRLAISHPTPEDSGTYTCKAENLMWSDSISHVVSFTGKESRCLSPNITTIEKSRFNRQAHEFRRPHFANVLSDHTVVSGGTIGLQVEIRGAPTRVEWLREGRSVTDTYKHAKTFVEQGLYTLALPDVTETESGTYTCRAWSSHGTVDMHAAVTVVPAAGREGRPASIAGRPEKDVLISVGEDLNISFRVHGDPKARVIFMKGTRDITTSQRVCKMTSDDYVKFTLKRAGVADAGTYCILARNAYGCDRAFVTVVVRQRVSSENLVSDWTYPDDSTYTITERNNKAVPERIPSEPNVTECGSNWVSLAWPKPDATRAVAPVLAYRLESWQLGKEGGARWVEVGVTPLNSFDVFNLKEGEQYHFRVTPKNRYGWGESVQTSTPIGVRSNGTTPEFVEILPGQFKVLIGEKASLCCVLQGKPTPEVVWMKNGHELEEEPGRVSSSFDGQRCGLTIDGIREEDEGRYSCEAASALGRTSTYARLAVVTDRAIWEADAKLKRERSADIGGEYPPQFTMRLRDRRVQATYPVRLTCQVVGSPKPLVTWRRDGQDLNADERHIMCIDEHFHTLEIAATRLEDGGVYEAVARNARGAVACRCGLVVDKGIRAYVAPDFCLGLDPLYRLNEGEELRVCAVVEAYPSVGVTWYRDGVRLRPSRRAVMTLDRDGGAELALAAVTPRDAGVYTCTANNEVGSATTSTRLEVIAGDHPPSPKRETPVLLSSDVPYSKEPMFIKKPRSSEAREGDTVIIECEVVGDPKPDVYWLRDFLKPDYYRDASHFKRVGGGPEYRFEIPHAKLDYTGAYSVVARNAHGEVKAIISLQILARDTDSATDAHNVKYGRVDVMPRFKLELTDLLCCDGDDVEFNCEVDGDPDPDVKWFRHGELIRESREFELGRAGGTARLRVRQVAAEDEGVYACEAANSLGRVTCAACLVVYPPGEPNTLSQTLRRPPGLSALSTPRSTPRATPRATPARSLSATPGPETRRRYSPSRQVAPKFYTYPHNKVVEEGSHVKFQCAVAGHPAPWAAWDKEGVLVSPSSRLSVREKDDMRILEIEEVTIEDAGLYRITLENDYGRVEASARLDVISHKGKFYGGVRTYSASPRRAVPPPSRRHVAASRQYELSPSTEYRQDLPGDSKYSYKRQPDMTDDEYRCLVNFFDEIPETGNKYEKKNWLTEKSEINAKVPTFEDYYCEPKQRITLYNDSEELRVGDDAVEQTR